MWDLGKHHDRKQNFTAKQAAGFDKICAQIQDNQSHAVHVMSCSFTILTHENYFLICNYLKTPVNYSGQTIKVQICPFCMSFGEMNFFVFDVLFC